MYVSFCACLFCVYSILFYLLFLHIYRIFYSRMVCWTQQKRYVCFCTVTVCSHGHRRVLLQRLSLVKTRPLSVVVCLGVTCRRREQRRRHADYVTGLAWHPATHELYTCGWDTQLRRAPVSDVALEHVKEQVRQMDVVESQ